jgi:hypothetical protein
MNNTVNINGQTFVMAEQFRALGTSWVRYVSMKDYHLDKEGSYVESHYITQAEWNEMFYA